MYICKPERNVNQVRALVTICTLVTAILFLLSTRVQYYAALIRLAAFISLVASILLVVRYALTEFEYSVSAVKPATLQRKEKWSKSLEI